MEYRQLGKSGLRVSVLALGTMTFGAKADPDARTELARLGAIIGSADSAAVWRQVDAAVDAGVNLVDTGDIYGEGAAEELLGDVLRGRRDRVLIATKARFPTGDGPNESGLSRHHLLAACEASLRRLQTDHIDLYHVHGWDGQTPVEETLAALDELVRSGKVRYIGCSNFSCWHLMKSLAASDRVGAARYVSHQICYSMLTREVEYELVPAALDQGLGIVAWSPLAGGLLSGKFRRGHAAPAGSRRSFAEWTEPPVQDEDQLWAIIEALVDVAEAHDASPAQVALRYLLERPGVTSLVIGARTDEQLADNLGAVDLRLTDDERTRLDAVSAPRLIYPYWHQAKSIFDRLGAADSSLLAPYVPR